MNTLNRQINRRFFCRLRASVIDHGGKGAREDERWERHKKSNSQEDLGKDYNRLVRKSVRAAKWEGIVVPRNSQQGKSGKSAYNWVTQQPEKGHSSLFSDCTATPSDFGSTS